MIDGLGWVALGSALGGVARFGLSGIVARRVGETFPWGTLAVNVSGALAIGLVAAAADLGHTVFASVSNWKFTVVGFFGSYTTVSAFSLQTLALARDGDFARAVGNILLSLALCLGAVSLGFAVGHWIFG